MATKITDLIPANAQYTVAGCLATVTIETGRREKSGGAETADVTARLRVVGEGEDAALAAEYASHAGELSQEQIDYALRAIETNDFGV